MNPTYGGHIQQTPVSAVLRGIEARGETGFARFETPQGAGLVWFATGVLLDAELGHFRAEAAVYRLLAQQTGTYQVYHEATATRPRLIARTVPELIGEAVSRSGRHQPIAAGAPRPGMSKGLQAPPFPISDARSGPQPTLEAEGRPDTEYRASRGSTVVPGEGPDESALTRVRQFPDDLAEARDRMVAKLRGHDDDDDDDEELPGKTLPKGRLPDDLAQAGRTMPAGQIIDVDGDAIPQAGQTLRAGSAPKGPKPAKLTRGYPSVGAAASAPQPRAPSRSGAASRAEARRRRTATLGSADRKALPPAVSEPADQRRTAMMGSEHAPADQGVVPTGPTGWAPPQQWERPAGLGGEPNAPTPPPGPDSGAPHAIADSPSAPIALPRETVTVGRYEILTRIARGGMGSVYLCRVTGEGGFRRLFALKVIRDHLSANPASVKMLLQEARLASQIHHPNVVGIVDIGTYAGQHYLVMDYVEGGTLAELLKAHPQNRPPRLILPIVLDSLAGLHAAHTLTDDNGRPLPLVHCDVSPQNMLLGTNGICRLSDFGISKARDASGDSDPTITRGKPAYLSPERIQGAHLDHRADIFAAGVVLWNALTGENLFAGASPEQTLQNVLRKPIPPPSQVGLRPPPAFDAICLKALQRDPRHRYQSADEMAMELRRVALAHDLLAPSSEVGAWVTSTFGVALELRKQAISHAAQRNAGRSAEVTPVPELGIGSSDGTEGPIDAEATLSNTHPISSPARAFVVLGASLAVAAAVVFVGVFKPDWIRGAFVDTDDPPVTDQDLKPDEPADAPKDEEVTAPKEPEPTVPETPPEPSVEGGGTQGDTAAPGDPTAGAQPPVELPLEPEAKSPSSPKKPRKPGKRRGGSKRPAKDPPRGRKDPPSGGDDGGKDRPSGDRPKPPKDPFADDGKLPRKKPPLLLDE